MSGRQPINGTNTLNRTPRADGGSFELFKDETIYGSNTLADPLGVNYNINKSIFVDEVYGDNSYAEKYQPLKPYETINDALGVAVAGETIVVRAGNYNQQLNLKDQVNFYFEQGAILSNAGTGTRIFRFDSVNNDYSVKIRGYAQVIYDGFREPFRFNGQNLDIDIQVESVSFTRQMFSFIPRQPNAKLKFHCNDAFRVDTTSSFYAPSRAFNFSGTLGQSHDENWHITWGGNSYANNLFSFGSGQTVTVVSKGDMYVTDLGYFVSVSYAGSKSIHYGNIYSLETYTGDPYGINSVSGLVPQVQGDVEINGNVYSLGQPAFRPVFANGTVKFKGSDIYSENVIPIFNRPTANGLAKIYFYSCTISDGNGNTSPNVIRVEDDPTSAFDDVNLYFYGCDIRKNTSFVGTGGVIYKNLPDTLSRVYIFGSTIICATNQDITETDILANGNFYFSSVDSNKALGINTTNVGGILNENKTYLE
jgi:hypothetical protein